MGKTLFSPSFIFLFGNNDLAIEPVEKGYVTPSNY